MPRIFISYRRNDTKATTGRIYDRLERVFGDKNIFMDVDDIPPGVDFRAYLQNEITQADVVLIVIGQKWASILKQRRNDPNDFVRIELESSLQQQKITIPLLVEGAAMPPSADLPERVKAVFPYLNAAQLGDNPVFHRDMDRLIEKLQNSGDLQPPPPLPLITNSLKRNIPFSVRSLIIMLAVLLFVGFVILQQWVVNQQQQLELTQIASTILASATSAITPTTLVEEVPTKNSIAFTNTPEPTELPPPTLITAVAQAPTETAKPKNTLTPTLEPIPSSTKIPTATMTSTLNAEPTDIPLQTYALINTPSNTIAATSSAFLPHSETRTTYSTGQCVRIVRGSWLRPEPDANTKDSFFTPYIPVYDTGSKTITGAAQSGPICTNSAVCNLSDQGWWWPVHIDYTDGNPSQNGWLWQGSLAPCN